MATSVVVIENTKTGEIAEAVYEHPFIVRLCHWVNAVALFVMVGSGLQIFRAFPSFGAKIPEKVLINWPKSLAIGGWLGGALQWHLTFMWIYIGTGLVYLGYQIFSGNYKQVLFVPRIALANGCSQISKLRSTRSWLPRRYTKTEKYSRNSVSSFSPAGKYSGDKGRQGYP